MLGYGIRTMPESNWACCTPNLIQKHNHLNSFLHTLTKTREITLIDFQKTSIFHLKPIAKDKVHRPIMDFLLEDESIFGVFQAVRDQLVFTNKRIIAANVQGMTGKKVDYTSIPYSKIQTFSIETAGTFDRDCELQLYVSPIGKISFNITHGFDIVSFSRMISQYIL